MQSPIIPLSIDAASFGAKSRTWYVWDRKAIRSVLVEQIVFDEEHFVELKAGKFIRKRRHAFANHNGRERAACLLDDLLRGGEGFEADVAPFALALFGDEKNLHRTRASCLSFSMSFAAISLGWPVINSVFFVFCGT
jgi:hypothetical protein